MIAMAEMTTENQQSKEAIQHRTRTVGGGATVSRHSGNKGDDRHAGNDRH
jgi:hypothetical protein